MKLYIIIHILYIEGQTSDFPKNRWGFFSTKPWRGDGLLRFSL